MKVTFHYHSCFSVELDNHILVFDYYNPSVYEGGSDTRKRPEFNGEKSIWFFSSHRHKDHFTTDIFDYKKQHPDVHYVISDDISVEDESLVDTFVSPNETVNISDLKIETLLSTDEGVAFIVTVEGKVIYHAGDLHWWYWSEKGPDYVKLWGQKYFDEIEKIKDRKFDISFALLDPRMGEGTNKGFLKFLETVPEAPMVFPMHMWKKYHIIGEFKNSKEGAAYKDRVIEIKNEGQEFVIE